MHNDAPIDHNPRLHYMIGRISFRFIQKGTGITPDQQKKKHAKHRLGIILPHDAYTLRNYDILQHTNLHKWDNARSRATRCFEIYDYAGRGTCNHFYFIFALHQQC